ncbi:MAG: NADH-quinone oxidoreductase subunit C [Candidatus Micrarchaeia archaeon]
MEAEIKPNEIRELAEKLKETDRLMAITAVDEGKNIMLCYHFWRVAENEIRNVKVKVKDEVDTISDIIPNASYYEREIHDLFGVEFKGAKLEPLLIPKGYKKYPLRKALEEKLNP